MGYSSREKQAPHEPCYYRSLPTPSGHFALRSSLGLSSSETLIMKRDMKQHSRHKTVCLVGKRGVFHKRPFMKRVIEERLRADRF